jgi:hypothetical protein
MLCLHPPFFLFQVDTGRRIENAQRDVSLECLDAHLKDVQLTPYKGRKSQVQLTRFFLSKAKVLKSMTFAGILREPRAKMDCKSA